MLRKLTVVGDPGDAQRPPESTTPHRLREAGRIWVHVRPPTRQPAGRVGTKAVTSPITHRDNPQQFLG